MVVERFGPLHLASVATDCACLLGRRYGQRLTFHPSHFVKLATADEALLCKSLHELEVHSQARRPRAACTRAARVIA